MPPPGSGPHRYRFHLYAVDQIIDVAAAEATKASVLEAIDGHVLEQAVLMGTFERQD
ncbi:Phosphatidylethanolamine-binding protein [Allorhodopirellula solitaria]|uniref:Phosphatidylethanolamine-binding protein n=1 Tax=Allorhodopirellula solitaria TaxID=2527987 RepID=A0A5C5XW66_9BACT|nr:Phosphatidylethanolamine-binding protein [Allorhodopirellula solitaria]